MARSTLIRPRTADRVHPDVGLTVVLGDGRYGGRLWTQPFGSAYIEYGANWIHGGSDQNELFRMAFQRDMLGERLEVEDRLRGLFYTSQGQSLDAELSRKCYGMFFEAEAEAGRLYRSHNLNKKRLHNKTLLQFLEEEWERVAAGAFPDDKYPARLTPNDRIVLMVER